MFEKMVWEGHDGGLEKSFCLIKVRYHLCGSGEMFLDLEKLYSAGKKNQNMLLHRETSDFFSPLAFRGRKCIYLFLQIGDSWNSFFFLWISFKFLLHLLCMYSRQQCLASVIIVYFWFI